MHPNAYKFIARVVADLPARGQVIEVGGRDINGSVRGLFGTSRYISIDLVDGPGVDIVGDILDFVPDQALAVDTVVCCEVFEHSPDWPGIVGKGFELLQEGGIMMVTCATDPRPPHSAVDGGQIRNGEYYANVSPEQLRGELARYFDKVQVEINEPVGDLYAVASK
jgi:hypothetical protein